MNPLLPMIGIKLKLLLRRPLLLALCLILPILLSLLAGATVERNDLAQLRAGYADLAGNEESSKLVHMLVASGMGWHPTDEAAISRAIELGQLDGALIIPPAFGDRQAVSQVDDAYACEYIPGKDSLADGLIRENFLVCLLALSAVGKLEKDLSTLPAAAQLSESSLGRMLEASTEEARRQGASLKVDLHNLDDQDVLPVIGVPDVAIEVFFLSIFSLLGSLLLADAATRQRLRSLPGGFRRDFLTSVLTLALTGCLQLVAMVGLTRLLLPGTSRPANYPIVMGVLLLFMLAYGQLVALIPGDRRFVPASLALFLSLMAGGGFIRLPSLWMEGLGQFTPHGWALAKLSGLPVTFPTAAMAASWLVLLLLAYFLQKKSTYSAA